MSFQVLIQNLILLNLRILFFLLELLICHCIRVKITRENEVISIKNQNFAVLEVHTHQALNKEQKLSEGKEVLVYEGPLKKRVKWVKLLSLSSSMLGFGFLPLVVKDLCRVNIFFGVTVGIVSTFFLSTPILLHWITKRYVIELYFDKETEIFTAKTYNIASQVTEIKFKATDVIVPELPGMLTSFLVKDSPLFVDANIVKDPDAYSIMMGYDKPFDFKSESERQEEKT